ncbi:hypothetical protein [Streptomyces sp. NPDC002851]
MTGIANVTVHAPGDWVPLSLDPAEDPRAWATAQAEELAREFTAEGHRPKVRSLARDLEALATSSRRNLAFAAFGLYIGGSDERFAHLDVRLVEPDEVVPEVTLEWLTEVVADNELGTPEVKEVEVGCGPAVRIRQAYAGARKGLFGTAQVIYSVVYGIKPRGCDSAVLLSFTWIGAGLSPDLEEMADQIADDLEVELAED